MTHFEIKDIEYIPRLVTIDRAEGPVPVGLYSVIVRTPHMGTQTHFVLALSEDAAAGMARCAMKCSVYDVSDKLSKEITTDVTRLPFSVEGWGKQKM